MMIGMIGDVIDLGFIYSKQAIVITDHKKKKTMSHLSDHHGCEIGRNT